MLSNFFLKLIIILSVTQNTISTCWMLVRSKMVRFIALCNETLDHMVAILTRLYYSGTPFKLIKW